ncbi:Conserved domain protein [hydrothermal vent metagenome]|uniref:Conserved domain protein n=1 Tax=hydrothermal vent metagenome TaxID=652676 RepID=A0A1W1C3M1_9ZZZZ
MDELAVEGEISSRIYTVRGKQVMLDRDLAELYQVETKYLKRQVQRNMNRFDEDDFMFVLDKNELIGELDN